MCVCVYIYISAGQRLIAIQNKNKKLYNTVYVCVFCVYLYVCVFL